MGVVWGSWDYSGGNGMRVGIDVDVDTPTHTTTTIDWDIHVWTENQYSYSDSQTLTYGGSISGTHSFTNSSGGSAVERDEVDYNYTYAAGSYGTSPGTKTFTAKISGAYNGVTPSVSVTVAIPARPYAVPAAPYSVSASRISDATTQVNWVRNATAGEPYDTQGIMRSVNSAPFAVLTLALSGAVTSYNDSTAGNSKYSYVVRGQNSVGVSGWGYSNEILTTPATPTGATRTGANGANQVITWTNTAGYAATSEWATEIYRSTNDGAYAYVGIVNGNAGVNNSFTDTYPATHSSDRFKYVVYHRTLIGSQGTLWSSASNETTQTTGVLLAPLAPTSLAPTGGALVNPGVNNTFTWTHNPADFTAQTKFQIRHRVVGAGSWTTITAVTSGTSSWQLPANTYAGGLNVEWQVSTWGLDPAQQGAWSNSATFNTLLVVERIPIKLNMVTGDYEAISDTVLATLFTAATLPNALPNGTSFMYLTAAESTAGGWPWGAVAGFLDTKVFVASGVTYATQKFSAVDGGQVLNQRNGSATTWGSWDDTGWLTVTYNSPWVTYTDVNFGISTILRRYRGVVYLRGLIAGGANGSTAFNLPVGFRPSSTPPNRLFTSYGSSGIVRIDITGSTGGLAVTSATTSWISLNGITFIAEQ